MGAFQKTRAQSVGQHIKGWIKGNAADSRWIDQSDSTRSQAEGNNGLFKKVRQKVALVLNRGPRQDFHPEIYNPSAEGVNFHSW
jgi:hypothetical protein